MRGEKSEQKITDVTDSIEKQIFSKDGDIQDAQKECISNSKIIMKRK